MLPSLLLSPRDHPPVIKEPQHVPLMIMTAAMDDSVPYSRSNSYTPCNDLVRQSRSSA